MISELPISQIPPHLRHFPDAQAQMVLASIAESNTSGQLWSIPDQDGEQILLWDKGNNVFYFSDLPTSAYANQELTELFQSRIRTRAIQEGLRRFKVRLLLDAPGTALVQLFQGVKLRRISELFFTFCKAEVPPLLPIKIPGVQLEQVNRDFLSQDYQNLSFIRDEIEWMWPSLDRFCEVGFGVAARLGNQVIGWCTAEYVSQRQCGIGIETLEAFEKQGIASATASCFVACSLERGITPHWECYKENFPSMRVAEKVGFGDAVEKTFWVGAFD